MFLNIIELSKYFVQKPIGVERLEMETHLSRNGSKIW